MDARLTSFAGAISGGLGGIPEAVADISFLFKMEKASRKKLEETQTQIVVSKEAVVIVSSNKLYILSNNNEIS